MKKSDLEEFAWLVEALAAAFGREADEALVTGYWLGLKDLELADVEAAITRAMRECEHMPRPVELRRGAGHIGVPERAVIAFGAVARAIRNHGHRASVSFDDPLVNAAVRNLGGWSRVCSLPSEEFEKWWRKDFERVYSALCQSGASEDACRHLPGADEAENAARFPERVPEPVLIECSLPPHRKGLLPGDRLRLVGRNE